MSLLREPINRSKSTCIDVLDSSIWKHTDPEKESASFFEALFAFMKNRRTPIQEIPKIGNYRVDLKKLFEHVCIAGGIWDVIRKELLPKLCLSLEIENTPSNVEALKNVYLEFLFAFERVFLFGLPDQLNAQLSASPDVPARNHIPWLINLQRSFPDFSQASNKSARNLNATQTEKIDLSQSENDLFAGLDMGNVDPSSYNTEMNILNEEEYDEEEKQEDNQESSNKNSLSNANALMEMFTVRLDRGRPLTWRKYMEPQEEKYSPQDFTKTPISKTPRRLMARSREGLFIHKIERALRKTNSPEFGASLKALVMKSWERSFYAALYPTLIERLLHCYRQLRERLVLLRSTNAYLFNTPSDQEETDLYHLVRISTIMRNLSFSQHNHNLMAMHPGIVTLLTEMVSLIPFASHVTQRSKLDLVSQKQPKSLVDALSLTLQLKCDHSASHLIEMQYNAMEALSKIVHIMRFKADQDLNQTQQLISDNINSKLVDISEFGKLVMNCLPRLMDIACSVTEKNASIFLAIEILSKIALNPNCRQLFLAQDTKQVVNLLATLIRFAIIDDELSEWAIFCAFQIALNAMNLPMAQVLCENPEVVDNLMLLCVAYNASAKTGTPEIVAALAYRRHGMAVKAASILHKLVTFVPIKNMLLKYEERLAEAMVNGTIEIANPLHRVLLEMQSGEERT